MVLYISTDHPRAQGPQGPPQVLGAARGHGDRPLVMSYLITIFHFLVYMCNIHMITISFISILEILSFQKVGMAPN